MHSFERNAISIHNRALVSCMIQPRRDSAKLKMTTVDAKGGLGGYSRYYILLASPCLVNFRGRGSHPFSQVGFHLLFLHLQHLHSFPSCHSLSFIEKLLSLISIRAIYTSYHSLQAVNQNINNACHQHPFCGTGCRSIGSFCCRHLGVCSGQYQS